MGCLFHKSRKDSQQSNPEMSQTKEYSWDKREKINIKDYTIENIVSEETSRLPGSVNGQQFIIQNCKDSTIFVLDHMNTVTIDDCINCKIVLGPVKGSLFLRDCKDCICVAACGQFRTRDCRKMDIFLCCATQPIIESSTSIRFGCYQLLYKNLHDHFNSAGLSIFNNNWTNIHDFTPIDGETNWCLLPQSIQIEDYIPIQSSEKLNSLNLSFSVRDSVVPYTRESFKMDGTESCLIIFFPDNQQQLRAQSFASSMKARQSGCLLMQTKECQLLPGDAERVFHTNDYSALVQRGPVIGLHFSGSGCYKLCSQAAQDISKNESPNLVYIASHPQKSHQQVQSFFNFSNIQLAE